MTIGLAQSMLERHGFDATHAAEVSARNYFEQPWRGYGTGPPRIFELMQRNVPWDAAARSLFEGSGSFGNGAAMRVAPVALLGYADLDRVADLARRSASVTHSHVDGMDGAAVQAVAIATLIAAPHGEDLSRPTLLQTLARYIRTDRFRAILEQLESMPAGLTAVNAARQLGNGIEAHRSVPLALYSFLETPRSFRDCILYAVEAGGDTDTIASMAGALSGAYLGEENIPLQWIAGMESAGYLRELADALFAISEGNR